MNRLKFINKKAIDFCDDVRDGTHDSPKHLESGKLLITSKNIKNGYVDLKNASYISEEDFNKINKRSKVNRNDILYSMIGTVGLVHRVDVEPDYAIKNIGLFKIKNELKSKWLYYYLNTPDIINSVNSKLNGSTQKFISLDNLRNLDIKYPENEQDAKRIIKILETIDLKMKLNNQINNNLYELMLNNFINFLERNKNSEIVKLEDCVEKINTGADAIQKAPIVDYNTGIKCIRIGDMTNGRDYHSWGFTKMTDKDFENYKLIRNDIVITRTAVNGLTYMITDEENTVCNNGNIRLRVNNKYNPLYIYLNTKTKDFRNYIDRINSETSVRPNMKVEYFTNYLIKKIDLNKQNEFCNKAETIMKKIQNNKKESYNLEQLRDMLLPKLMNGEIDLDNIEI